MENYRLLREEEIQVLEQNGCWAEDWEHVMVDEAFKPYNFHRVVFYGNIRLGRFDKQVEVSKGFMKHSGINDATLRRLATTAIYPTSLPWRRSKEQAMVPAPSYPC